MAEIHGRWRLIVVEGEAQIRAFLSGPAGMTPTPGVLDSG